MTFLEIEAFLKITETGSFSAAADALYVTQPALGRRIRAMEEELGYPLFVRGKGLRKVELTRQGHAFIGIAHRWQALWNETTFTWPVWEAFWLLCFRRCSVPL